MGLFGGGKPPPVAISSRPEPDKSVWEVHEIYGQDDIEIHLVLAYDSEDAVIRHLKTKEKNSDRVVQGFKANKCTRYASITLGARKYI